VEDVVDCLILKSYFELEGWLQTSYVAFICGIQYFLECQVAVLGADQIFLIVPKMVVRRNEKPYSIICTRIITEGLQVNDHCALATKRDALQEQTGTQIGIQEQHQRITSCMRRLALTSWRIRGHSLLARQADRKSRAC
jgi:hypothetical protein